MSESAITAERLPTFRLASLEIGPETAYTAFRQITQDIFDVTLPDHASAREFRVNMDSWHLGSVMLGSIEASALRFERSAEMAKAGGLDHVMVQLYTEGGFQGSADHRDIIVRPGDICLFDLTGSLRTEASAFHNITLLAPRSWFATSMIDDRFLNGLVMDRSKPLTQLLAAHLLALADRAPLLNPREASAIARGTVALIGALLDSIPPDSHARAQPPVPSAFRNICDYIDRHLSAAALHPNAIAAVFGMSRASLYRLFEPVGGVSDYIRRRRLARAALDLTSAAQRDRRIGQIAFDWGFPSEAAFSRNFKSLFGLNPSEARARADRIWTAQLHGDSATPSERDFTIWMKTLRVEEPH